MALLLYVFIVAAGNIVETPHWSIRAFELIEERPARLGGHGPSTAGHEFSPSRVAMMHTVVRRFGPTIVALVFLVPYR